MLIKHLMIFVKKFVVVVFVLYLYDAKGLDREGSTRKTRD
jgi:hypothetical protein